MQKLKQMTELFSHIQKKSLDYSNLSNQDLHKKYHLELTSVRSQVLQSPETADTLPLQSSEFRLRSGEDAKKHSCL